MKMAATEGKRTKRKNRKNKRFLGGLSRSMVSRASFVSRVSLLFYCVTVTHTHKQHTPNFFISEAVDIVFAALSQQFRSTLQAFFVLF
jgi:ribosomal protein L44E